MQPRRGGSQRGPTSIFPSFLVAAAMLLQFAASLRDCLKILTSPRAALYAEPPEGGLVARFATF